jgi:predicted O-methyltransferase YrrM
MSSAFDRVLARYQDRAQRENKLLETEGLAQLVRRRDELLLHVGEDVARLLRALAVARKAKRLVELGTSYGYSTLFLADAARETGGTLMTFEIDESKQRYARREIEDAGLGQHVEWHRGDATQLLPTIDGPVDFVLIDLWKDLYVPCFEILYPKLAEHALIAADNMLEPRFVRPDAEAYRSVVRGKPGVQTVLLPVGNGVELSCVWRQGAGIDRATPA